MSSQRQPTGFINIEGTCYMNAALQCLIYIEELTNYLLRLKQRQRPKKTEILEEYLNILCNNQTQYNPCEVTNLRKNMEKINSRLFQVHKGHDPSDMLMYFFNYLQDDLKPLDNYKLWFNEKMKNNPGLKKLYENYIDKTIINDLFNYIIEEKKSCQCPQPKYNYQTQQFIILYVNNDDTIENYLNSYKKQYISQQVCMTCHHAYAIQKYIKIHPKYMIIVLKPQNKNKIYYADFDEFVYRYEGNQKIKYQFNGMIVHIGDNSDAGHFYAYCRIKNNTFYEFNDLYAKEVEFEIIRKNVPYILFYKRISIEKCEEEIKNVGFNITGNLTIELPITSRKIWINLDFSNKRYMLKTDARFYSNEYNIIQNIVSQFTEENSLFDLNDLGKKIEQLELQIKNSLNI